MILIWKSPDKADAPFSCKIREWVSIFTVAPSPPVIVAPGYPGNEIQVTALIP